MKCLVALFALGVLAASMLGAQQMPSELATLVSRAGLTGAIGGWCRGTFRPGHPGGFAIAVTAAPTGGRYLLLDSDGAVSELGSFDRRPDLACYSRAQAKKLDIALRRSSTLHGRIVPRWNTTVICAFVNATGALCWQYSPKERRLIHIGEWVT